MNNILWVTGFNKKYYDYVFTKTQHNWVYLPGEQVFLIDEPILELSNDHRTFLVSPSLYNLPKNLTNNELKFWRKSRSLVTAMKLFADEFDYIIWIDADVTVLEPPDLIGILPEENQLLSVVNKIIDYDKTINKFENPYLVDLGLDTGFVAYNCKYQYFHQWLELYENFWNTESLYQFVRKYDTYVLDKIISDNNFEYKNLWNGIRSKGKYYCGFENSPLEKFFYHYWGRKQKDNLQ